MDLKTAAEQLAVLAPGRVVRVSRIYEIGWLFTTRGETYSAAVGEYDDSGRVFVCSNSLEGCVSVAKDQLADKERTRAAKLRSLEIAAAEFGCDLVPRSKAQRAEVAA